MAELARRIGVSPQVVNNWRARGSIPPQYVVGISVATGVRPHDLRPDLYPDPDWMPKLEAESAK